MVLWWIGNVILLVVVLPVVIWLLNRVLAALERIRAASDNVLAGGVALVGQDHRGSKGRRGPVRGLGGPPPRLSLPAERTTAMPAAAWMTLIVAALIIAITAVGLLRVIFHLRAIRKTLVATSGGVAVVAQQTSTVPERLTSVNANLKPVRDFCETV